MAILFIAFSASVWQALILFGLVGVTQTIISITIDTLVQKHFPNEILGRTFATMGIIVSVCQLLSMATGGILADIIGIRSVYIIAGMIILTVAILASRYIYLPGSVPIADN